jgi:cytochrome P450
MVWKLPFAKIQRVNDYFISFEQHVMEMVDERRALGADGVQQGDLFSNLIRASDAEQGNAQFDRTELLSNIHIFLLAGHETTAGTLMATLMLLAMYPEDQERVAEEAKAAFAHSDGIPGYEAFGELASPATSLGARLAWTSD